MPQRLRCSYRAGRFDFRRDGVIEYNVEVLKMTTIKAQSTNPLKRLLRRIALSRLAKALVRASKESKGAGDDILYRLPGVFSMRIAYKDVFVRLIKEGNEFRILGSSEKSEELLSVVLSDGVALAELTFHASTWQKIYAEGRVAFAGKVKFAAVFVRIAAHRDKDCLSSESYRDLYGE